MDLAELRSKVTDKTKAVVIITPNNPTGGVLSQDTLQGLADLAIEKDLLVISDEVYERLIYDGEKHISCLLYTSWARRRRWSPCWSGWG